VAAGLQPAAELAVRDEEDRVTRGLHHDRACRDVPVRIASPEGIGPRQKRPEPLERSLVVGKVDAIPPERPEESLAPITTHPPDYLFDSGNAGLFAGPLLSDGTFFEGLAYLSPARILEGRRFQPEGTMTRKKKRWILLGILGVLVAGGAVVAMRGKDKSDAPKELPFRLGKVQAEDLQVSVREVGVVDPVTKVDVKSPVSGRVVGLRVREGAVVRVGDVLAEIEPDVNQAQSLSDVQSGVTDSRIRLQDAERDLANQKALFDSGLIGRDALRIVQNRRDLAAQALRAAEMRFQIVQDRGIPISGNSSSQKARVTSPMNGVIIKKGVELGQTVTSGVSSFNEGTALFTVADLKSLIIRVNLNEVDIAKVAVGQPVRITLDAYPQKLFTGRVSFVSPSAELVEKIKVFKVEITLDELGAHFKTGMSANVEILGEKRDKAISIPLEALQRREGETISYRLKPNLKPQQISAARAGLAGRSKFIWLADHWKDYFDVVPVKAGIATLERVEIVAGLMPGQQVSLEDPTKKKIEKDEDD
jgi:RND family efflux transporter MFP subunit